MRGEVTQALSRSVVECVDRIIDFFVGDVEQVGALGEILAQQPVGVFVEPPLPGVVGVREVHLGL